jgi:hypothetical protein
MERVAKEFLCCYQRCLSKNIPMTFTQKADLCIAFYVRKFQKSNHSDRSQYI